MGWIIIIAVKPLYLNVPTWGLFWLLAGGLAYTAGVGFYAADRIRYAHFIRHLFVIAGTACHFIAVLRHLKETMDYYQRIEVAEMEGDLLKAILSRNLGKIEAKYKKLIEAQNLLSQSVVNQLVKRI